MGKSKIKLLHMDFVRDAINECFATDSVEFTNPVVVHFGVRIDGGTRIEVMQELDTIYGLIDTSDDFWSKLAPALEGMWLIPQGKIRDKYVNDKGVIVITKCSLDSIELMTARNVDNRIKSIGQQLMDEAVEEILLNENAVDE